MLETLRLIKSPLEMQYLQKAIDITCRALRAAMVRIEPDLFEYQVQATIEFVFKDMGAGYPAFPCIIGSGPNSTILHYAANERQIADGELLLMDIGAEYRGYSADVTRTVPVNGVFSSAQGELYDIVLRAQKAAIAAVKPGVTRNDVHAVAKGIIEEAGYGPYFMHGTSHFLGLDTHDVGERSETLQPGMVLTVEPGIYIRENAEVNRKYWNIGIRIEDDVLVTEDGAIELSQSAPREITEIEALMRTN
jgi:Xaa-Pro aminopeptidase